MMYDESVIKTLNIITYNQIQRIIEQIKRYLFDRIHVNKNYPYSLKTDDNCCHGRFTLSLYPSSSGLLYSSCPRWYVPTYRSTAEGNNGRILLQDVEWKKRRIGLTLESLLRERQRLPPLLRASLATDHGLESIKV